MIVPVILAGGTGSRLWPLSRSAFPKQFLPLVSGKSMLQETVLRTQSIPNCEPPIVICNQEHRFLVEEQLKNIGIHHARVILEPMGRNTASAVTIASLFLTNFYKPYRREKKPLPYYFIFDFYFKCWSTIIYTYRR